MSTMTTARSLPWLSASFLLISSLATGAVVPGTGPGQMQATRHGPGSHASDAGIKPAPAVTPASTRDECRILLFSSNLAEDEVTRLQDLGYSVTTTLDPDQLQLENLLDFNVVVIRWIGAGVIGMHQSDLASFVADGGSLLIHNPAAVGAIDYAPTGFDVVIESEDWCNYFSSDYWTCLVDASHPITQGLTNLDLPGAWSVVESLGPAYLRLTENCVCLDPSLAAGVYDRGKIVFDTGYFSPTTLVPGSDAYVIQLFDYLCSTNQVPVDNAMTWGGLKTLYR